MGNDLSAYRMIVTPPKSLRPQWPHVPHWDEAIQISWSECNHLGRHAVMTVGRIPEQKNNTEVPWSVYTLETNDQGKKYIFFDSRQYQ